MGQQNMQDVQYLMDKKVPNVVNQMIKSLLEAKPDDCMPFLAEWCKKNTGPRRLVIFASNTPDKADFAAMVKVKKIEYDFATTTSEQFVEMVEKAADAAGPFEAIALANHGDDAGKAGFQWKISESIVVTGGTLPDDVTAVIEALSAATIPGGRVDLLACDLLSDPAGRAAFAAIGRTSRTHFAASTNATGNTKAGGDWVMESDGMNIRSLYFDESAARVFDGTFGESSPLCSACGNSVNYADMVTSLGVAWHRACLICNDVKCRKTLSPGNHAHKDGKPFCNQCYSVQSARKGYDWKDSNLALFGSDVERKVKKESAEAEPAWQGAGQEVGLQIWRIVKFNVTHWEKEQYGEFYNGDTYIILNTYKEEDSDALAYDVHFWVGKYSTQDEYGTAAYKTVELDTLLDDKPVQHREVQGHESALFQSYFDRLALLKGGADTGFNRVPQQKYEPRLLRIGRQRCVQIPMKIGNLESDGIFIIDNGLEIWQFNGKRCPRDLQFKAAQEIQKMKRERPRAKIDVIEEINSHNHPALKLFKEGKSKTEEAPKGKAEMCRLSDANGLNVVDGYGRDKLTSEDVYIINTGTHCFCWIGSKASVAERKNALAYANNYLGKTATPTLPISVIAEGKPNAAFDKEFPA